MKKFKPIFVLMILLPAITLFGQEPNFKEGNNFYRSAMNYYKAGQYDSLLINMQKALELRPNHPAMTYNLAVAFVLNNRHDEAFRILQKMAKMGLFYGIEKDTDFKSVFNMPEFRDIVMQMKQNSLPTGNAVRQLEYPEKDLITESVAIDPKTGTYYLSSIHKRKIVMMNKDGATGNFKSEMEDGLWSVSGIKIDQKHRLLYACTSPTEQMIDFIKEEKGKGALLKYDLDSGKLLKKYSFDNKETSHIFGDLAIDNMGNVYISDSRENSVYRISYGSDEIEQIIKPGKFVSLQGLDLDEENENLYLADYALGLYSCNLASGKLTYIAPSDNFVPQGIDGLYFYKNSLIATQNGTSPQRVVRLYLNRDRNKIDRWEILEANNPAFDEITLGVIYNDNFYFIANSQWNSFNKDGSIFPMEKLKKPVVLRIKL